MTKISFKKFRKMLDRPEVYKFFGHNKKPSKIEIINDYQKDDIEDYKIFFEL